jgi:DinB superfamily
MSTFAPDSSPAYRTYAIDATTLSALANFPPQLEAHYAAIPEEFRNWSPLSWEGVPSEPFTAIEQICHVRDIEVEGYHIRLQRTLSESNPTLASIDSEILAKKRSYATSDPAEVFASFRAARVKSIELISGLSPEHFDRTAVFEGYGDLTLRSLVHYLCSHDQQHLAGLQWLLGKIEASRNSIKTSN